MSSGGRVVSVSKISDVNELEEDEVRSMQFKIILLGDGAVGKVRRKSVDASLDTPAVTGIDKGNHEEGNICCGNRIVVNCRSFICFLQTSIAMRFADDQFSQNYKQTVGVDFFIRRLNIPRKSEPCWTLMTSFSSNSFL
jgi:Ras family